MSKLNPDDFIITRKRKKYKFALFANSPLCFEFDEWQDAQMGTKVDVLEVGAGDALFSVELAIRYPEKNFVAIDVKADRLQKGAKLAERLGLGNVRFVRARADLIGELFQLKSISTIWLTFPDPFPKERGAKHRLTHQRFLGIYKKLLTSSGELYLKHDNSEFFNYSLEQIVNDAWRVTELSFDLHDSNLSDDYKILTTYEKRWMGEGLRIKLVRALLTT